MCVGVCVGGEVGCGGGVVSQMEQVGSFPRASSVSGFVPGHPLAWVFGGNSVKLLSQVYWSPGLLEREVIYPLAFLHSLCTAGAITVCSHEICLHTIRRHLNIATITQR